MFCRSKPTKATRKRSREKVKTVKQLAIADKAATDAAECRVMLAELTLEQRRMSAVAAFQNALAAGCSKMHSYSIAALATGTSTRYVSSWVKAYMASKDRGEFVTKNYGGSRTPSFLADPNVEAAAREWWRAAHPKRGTKNASIGLFKEFMCGKNRCCRVVELL